MNKAFNKYGKAAFKSIIPKRSKAHYILKGNGIDYKNPRSDRSVIFTFGGVESSIMSEVEFIEGLKMIERIL